MRLYNIVCTALHHLDNQTTYDDIYETILVVKKRNSLTEWFTFTHFVLVIANIPERYQESPETKHKSVLHNI